MDDWLHDQRSKFFNDRSIKMADGSFWSPQDFVAHYLSGPGGTPDREDGKLRERRENATVDMEGEVTMNLNSPEASDLFRDLKRKVIRARVLAFALFLLLVAVIAQSIMNHTWRTNSCTPGLDGKVIHSEADAIAAAKRWVVRDRFFHRPTFDGEAFVRAAEQTPGCCQASRSETLFGVVIWEVYLRAERDRHEFRNYMNLTNCGEIFHDSEFKD